MSGYKKYFIEAHAYVLVFVGIVVITWPFRGAAQEKHGLLPYAFPGVIKVGPSVEDTGRGLVLQNYLYVGREARKGHKFVQVLVVHNFDVLVSGDHLL